MRYLFSIFFMAAGAFGADDIACTRNYLSAAGNPCESFPTEYAYLVNADPDALFEACARKRTGYCGLAEEFIWVIAKNGEKVCIQRFDTSLVNLCEQGETTSNFVYIKIGNVLR